MQFYFYQMECEQVKEKLEDTNVTDKEVTLKSVRLHPLKITT